MEPRHFLRVEGLAVLVIALGGYLALKGPLWPLAALALAPDLSMLSYLGGPRVGSPGYNVVHTYALPLVLGAAGLRAGSQLPLLVALVWAGHIGADRAFGYGLKFESGFEDTYLSTQPAPEVLLGDSERAVGGLWCGGRTSGAGKGWSRKRRAIARRDSAVPGGPQKSPISGTQKGA